jgi:mono/diheme cytochrome c family protein
MPAARRALATAAAGALVAAAVPAWSATDGAALFSQHCAVCHQETAVGTTGLAPTLLGEHWLRLGANRHYLPSVLTKGLAGPIKVAGQTINAAMPVFGGLIDDSSLAAIANHLRGLQGAADEPPYTADDLATARGKPGNQMSTRALRRQILGE